MRFNPSDIPKIAITGSVGKTTTREMLGSILDVKWKVLKNSENKNLPLQNKAALNNYNSSYKAILLEMGMGQPGAAKRHCKIIEPNIAIITKIGRAHYGNLGNSIESTAKNKSELIKYMHPTGTLLINADDENSRLLETDKFKGEIVTIGIANKADYQASEVEFLEDGMGFKVGENSFFVPTFGVHNVYNALFAIATAHRLKFSMDEIRKGLENYQVPTKRLNFHFLKENSILIDDTVNANPESVKTAIDVLAEKGKGRKKIVVLGSMKELGDYETRGHMEVGQYLVQNNVDFIFTYGKEAELIGVGAIEKGFPKDRVRHFDNKTKLHKELCVAIEKESIILVKGSSKMRMYQTIRYIKDYLQYTLCIDDNLRGPYIKMNTYTFESLGVESKYINLHFGALVKKLEVHIDPKAENGTITLPKQLNETISIPDVTYEYHMEGNHLHLGPLIGIITLPRYFDNPRQQILRFTNYDNIKGLIFICKLTTIKRKRQTIDGLYYNPKTNDFEQGVFPYPNAFYNRVGLKKASYTHLKEHIGAAIFNYPYENTDKWSFHKMMIKKHDISPHLPHTMNYSNSKSLIEMLRDFPSVYIKPSTTAGGYGIIHVEKNEKHFVVTDSAGNRQVVSSQNSLIQKLKGQMDKGRKYIIQQDIPFRFEGSKVDFRMYIQKNELKDWIYTGLETKVANEGSIISNSKNRKTVLPGKEALTQIFCLSEEEATKKIEEISALFIKVLNVLERKSHIGDSAIDFIIDENHKVWILEVQLNYAAEIKAFRSETEQKVLPYILPTPLEYAKSLTGF
ncbi:YheC/YheD family protein [Alkalicella caledoniensis]|uniref:YheC/YheD family protein n=1 Tax=Alkalicella caledoniensis TaxID=2731377 RepID=A0A7G9W478_ALKCA|nr:YheC/YheD family protein [Alkalicella caledoniensis]QNO13490.1 YheC/YheD family protein [Alkalicella caledoniensis]